LLLVRRAIVAGAFYTVIVFLVGFVLGIVRVLVLVPWLGGTAAAAVEVSVMLIASSFVSRASVNRLGVPPKVGVRSLMGAVAVLMLILAEFALGVAFSRPLVGQFASLVSWPGAISLAGQIAISILPVVQARCGHTFTTNS
jgi:hypothetical protein